MLGKAEDNAPYRGRYIHRALCSHQIADAGGETPPLRGNAYMVRGVCTKSRIRGVREVAPYRMNAYMMHFVRRNM